MSSKKEQLDQIAKLSQIPKIIAEPISVIEEKIIQHKILLEKFGISSLSNLGTLNVAGNVIPQVGLLRPLNTNINQKTLFSNATTYDKQTNKFKPLVGQGDILVAQPFPSSILGVNSAIMSKALLPINVAYWVAQNINIADDTNIVLQNPNKFLVIIAENITVGNNVTFSYERQSPATPPRPNKPSTPPQSDWDGFWGVDGAKGNKGYDGTNAPFYEIWAMNFMGKLNVDLRGQDGGRGSDGGDGGDGGMGRNGNDSIPGKLQCKSGPTSGRPGGKGGRAGDGGNGGNGGNGGDFDLYTSQNSINSILTSGFYISIDGGAAGMPGGAGKSGNGGPGGKKGRALGFCANSWMNWSDRVDGVNGQLGETGNMGLQGGAGTTSNGATVSFNPIDINIFNNKLTEPAIITLSKAKAIVGETISISGLRFTTTDKVFVNSVLAPTTIISDTLISFTIPNVVGGYTTVQVKQTDGTTSNFATIYLKPQIIELLPTLRVRPGTQATVKGKGFTSTSRVRLNNQDMPNIVFVDSETLKFDVVRPSGIIPNSAGEEAILSVVHSEGEVSNTLNIVLDTYKILCIGDSIMWGQGLTEQQKFYWQTETAIRTKNANIGVYKEVAAHSGAIIGVGQVSNHEPFYGEIPTNFPTIFEQANKFKNKPDAAFVDLCLVDGGINDMGISVFLKPSLTPQKQQEQNDKIIEETKKYAYTDMKALLVHLTESFPTAKIIVTGYFPPISHQSKKLKSMVKFYLSALGIVLPPDAIIAIKGVEELTDLAFESVANQSILAANELNKNLDLAVSEVNLQLVNQRVFFADPKFKEENAAFAPQPWIFSTDLAFNLEDYVIRERANACELEAGDNGKFYCKHASLGHPNEKGAIAYFKAIEPFIN